jgi:hypothetical protein
LNFVLHGIWGHRLTWIAIKHLALNNSQYAIPGQTCHNAILNKKLFLDSSIQTLQPGIMTDYGASSALDRVLAALSIVTCQQMALPPIAGHFMYNLLHNMTFYLMTGFGCSASGFKTNEDLTNIGQGMFQGSSCAAPFYIPDSDVSLSTYNRLSTGAMFTHPITGESSHDKSMRYVDNTTKVLNHAGANLQFDSTILSETSTAFLPFTPRNGTLLYGMSSCGYQMVT